ncbi:hypothetical protein FCH28_33545 [Streptomyces piniterrae]|uniref:DUF320 domain-containing protein n=1 Tax=Streptomyces piniterrae TaxID=2571125 RepID=A0A4U0MPX7_9ACTN|nr:hypothetical protein [Streptomyces piniterrae]TJZ42819.1 hypothetical protein FCH28_33545 [Streptomyces piniterrae]
MRKLHKAAVMAAVLGSVGGLGVGTAAAHGEPGHDVDVKQATHCKSHDMNVDVLGAVGVLNGTLGNAVNGEGSPGAQPSQLGSKMSCDNHAF